MITVNMYPQIYDTEYIILKTHRSHRCPPEDQSLIYLSGRKPSRDSLCSLYIDQISSETPKCRNVSPNLLCSIQCRTEISSAYAANINVLFHRENWVNAVRAQTWMENHFSQHGAVSQLQSIQSKRNLCTTFFQAQKCIHTAP